jgi:hypothetical protein
VKFAAGANGPNASITVMAWTFRIIRVERMRDISEGPMSRETRCCCRRQAVVGRAVRSLRRVTQVAYRFRFSRGIRQVTRENVRIVTLS